MKKTKFKTPLSEARNLGPVTIPFLNNVGIDSLEELREIGWQEASLKLMSEHARFIHLNLVRALIGACLNRDFRDIPAKDLEEARKLVKLFRESSG